MSGIQSELGHLYSQEHQTLEEFIEQYELGWPNSQLMSLKNSLETEHEFDSPTTLVELLETDLELRIRQPIKVEDYLTHFPRLAEQEDCLTRLVAAEYRLKTQSEDRPVLASYLQRFPAIRDRLLQAISPIDTKSVGSVTAKPASVSGRYELVELLDKGGRGNVSLARDNQLGRLVCVKQMRDEFENDEESQSQFLKEAKLTGKLEHPNIVPIHGIGTDSNGLPYYAMRFIRGVSMKEKIRALFERDQSEGDTWALSQRELLNRFLSVCNAIQYANGQGIIHRDIKPTNIMLGDFGETMVVDWGLAKRLNHGVDPSQHGDSVDSTIPISDEATTGGTVAGSPAYMSPEQARGRASMQTDVYCLGAVLYEIITGQPHRMSATATEAIAKAQSAAIVAPRRINRNIPRPLESICMRALSLSTADRYPDARSLANDIERFLAQQPVSSHRESMTEMSFRLVRKNRGVAMVSFLAMMGITIASLFTALSMNRARNLAVVAYAAKEDASISAQDKQRVFELFSALIKQCKSNELGQRVTLADALWSVTQSVEQLFDDRPSEKSWLTSNLASVFSDLSELEKAESTAKSAFEIDKQTYGERHPTTLIAKMIWADAVSRIGRTEQALGIFEEAHQELLKVLDRTDERAIEASIHLANAYGRAGRLEKSLDTHLEVSNLCDENLGRLHDLSVDAIGNIGYAHKLLGRGNESMETLNECLRRHQERGTLGDLSATGPTMTMGSLLVLGKNGKDKKRGMQLLQIVHDRRSKQLRAGHNSILAAKRELSDALAKTGNTKAAIKMIRDARGYDSISQLVTGWKLSQFLEIDGQLTAALHEVKLVDSATWKERNNKKISALRCEAGTAVIRILIKQGNYDEAERHLDELRDRITQFPELSSRELEQWLTAHEGDLCMRRKNLARAEKLLTQSVKESDFANAEVATYTLSLAGETLTWLGSYGEAERLLLAAADMPGQLHPVVQHYVEHNRQCLVKLYEAWGRMTEAKKWRVSRESDND